MKRALAVLVSLLFCSFHLQAQTVAIRYEGSWTNTTFGSVGKAFVDVSIQGATATLKFDLDGFVFGTFDPPLITIPATVENGVVTFDARGIAGFGDIAGNVTLASGATVIDVTNVPNDFIGNVHVTGTFGQNMDLQYTVVFKSPPNSDAVGVIVGNGIPPLRITSVQILGDRLELSWTGGKPPYQVQTTTAFGAPWQNSGSLIPDRNSSVPASRAGNLLVRILGQ
jgi:hypothetical protein